MRGPGANVKTRYGLQAVIHLARQERDRVVSVSEMAAVMTVSAKFLEDILGALRMAGIVRSRRGKDGGYQLILSPAELTALDVARAMEGPDAAAGREADGSLSRVTARVFDRALEAAAALLAEMTIDQLAEEARGLEVESAVAYMYHL